MEVDNYLHPHKLRLIEQDPKDIKENGHLYECFCCLQIISGPFCICEMCEYGATGKFVLHRACAELPPQMQKEAFHPHPLNSISSYSLIVCDGCGKLWTGFVSYKCYYCTFNLCFRCAVAFSNYHNYELAAATILKVRRQIKTTIHHFSHNHQLTRCKFFLSSSKWEIHLWQLFMTMQYCMACKQKLHDSLVYTCLSCEFIIHESCVNGMPSQILRSPFHPQHILLPRHIHRFSALCRVCKLVIHGISFYCNACNDNLHVSCAKYQTCAIKHNCHPHPLLQLGKSITREILILCRACHKNDSSTNEDDFGNSNTDEDDFGNSNTDEDANNDEDDFGNSNTDEDDFEDPSADNFLSCINCDFHVHLECISLPPRVIHARHLHAIMLTKPFVEDDSGDYYCDMCETERNSEHYIYYCEECNYIGHIGCAILEPKDMFLDQRLEENSDKAEIGDKKIMDVENLESKASLVHSLDKIIQKDSFHPHPLTLNKDEETRFVCDGCGELYQGLSYNCEQCRFSLDTKCATLNDDLSYKDDEAKKGREIKNSITHFSHYHRLNRCKINISKTRFDLSCKACKKGPYGYGLMYACLICEFVLHESCLNNMPRQIQSPLHPEDLLFAQSFDVGTSYGCHICLGTVRGFGFLCYKHHIIMHYSCANYQNPQMKHKYDCHVNHHLLHLGKSIFFENTPKCDACHETCNSTLFCCKKCNFYIHLECIPLPSIVKHKRHLHQLTLTNSVVEDDSGKYYCDACETERNPEHDVYYCKECTYIAHIDCVISEAEPPEKIIEHLVPRSRKGSKANYKQEIDWFI